MMMKNLVRISTRRGQVGLSLLEALVALVVMAFGMLSLAAMQLNLSRSADVAKQRTEAMRIAQGRIEQARSFTDLNANAGAVDWVNLQADVASPATVTANTNTAYTVAVAVGGNVDDGSRPINVQVAWTDRANEAQNVSISSVISKADPRDPGFVGNPLPLNRPLRRPKNRDINIPYPAVDLANGTSGYQVNANYVIVFSNLNANVVQLCDPNRANATAAQILASTCTTVTGYIVAGYIGRTGSSVAWPTGMNHSSITRNTAGGQPIKCGFGAAVDQNNNASIANFYYYICVVPVNAPLEWSGTMRIGGVLTTGDYIVCRYQYTQTTVDVNERNIQPYTAVAKSLDEQNYLLTTSDTATCPSAMTMTGVSLGVLHQNCRSTNTAGYLATNCPAASP
jgi:Tfp pilus assembly protein PilV